MKDSGTAPSIRQNELNDGPVEYVIHKRSCKFCLNQLVRVQRSGVFHMHYYFCSVAKADEEDFITFSDGSRLIGTTHRTPIWCPRLDNIVVREL